MPILVAYGDDLFVELRYLHQQFFGLYMRKHVLCMVIMRLYGIFEINTPL